MKKISNKERLRIKLLNLQHLNNQKAKNRPTYHLGMPQKLSLFNSKFRDNVLRNIEKMQMKHASRQCCFIDFNKVDTLMPDGTIHFLHQLAKLPSLNIKGRTAQAPIVKSMLSKLGVHNRMGIPSFEFKHRVVDNWYYMMGETADFGDEFIEIQNALHEVLNDPDEEFIVSTAISEAVSNVVHHGYDKNSNYKKWLLFVGISDTRCDIIISDLGMTIPKTAPKSLGEKIKDSLQIKWSEKADADRIELATTWRKSSTNDSHRGKGFDNIIQVKEVRSDTYIHVLSRRGAWSSEQGKRSYANPVNGTIVYWSIPVKNSLSSVNS
ncbi:hypothetical protein [Acinetobacter tibetensis]|uniref:ATP-binding protein n=1 Tax=Acinetobacter tibetensis TaxID=2943497 RepID=A0AAE9RYZ2_9GAMM|nr:hypothetical protein [Acinetobacter tibetensis]USE82057.1 hypothetical protein M5E07_09510 [Acinetobacter tibetensis]